MGVLNITPDSFSDGGKLFKDRRVDLSAVQTSAQQMIEQGASVLDIGGESTRPGALPVGESEEIDRVIPVVEALTQLNTILSVDTRHAAVAAAAIAAGAHIINDVSAGSDPEMLPTIAASQAGYAMMHMQGLPENMQQSPRYGDVIDEVSKYLQQRYLACLQMGIDSGRLMLDPGFGFGKTLAHNLQLLDGLARVKVSGVPLLVGLSRKSMLGTITGKPVEDRAAASVAAAMIAVQRGADMVRVHDVAATRDALKVLQALSASGHC
ncbi:MAG: dihydropteroate synthase [Pseudomonadaceae bacterium]|nr:dihydropteroate synthase [Pseudomonadaceae bacterium]